MAPATQNRDDKVYSIRQSPFGPGQDAVLEGPWDPEVGELIRSGAVDGLSINFAKGFTGPDIEFVRDLPLRRVFMIARHVDDVAPLSTLHDLEFLHLHAGPKVRVDLAAFPRLRRLGLADWKYLNGGVTNAGALDDLYVGHYSPDDLQPVSGLRSLRKLRLDDRPSLRSLHGVEALVRLEDLTVAVARKLSDISGVRGIASSLRCLDLESDRNLPDLEPVSQLVELQHLNAANCGDVPTLEPLRDLAALESLYLYESTRIVDGDLSVLFGLPALRDLRLMNRRHYAPTVKAVQEVIDARRGPL
jgi:hypothetical protein